MGRKIIDDEFIGRLETLGLWLKTQMNGYFGGNHKAPILHQQKQSALRRNSGENGRKNRR